MELNGSLFEVQYMGLFGKSKPKDENIGQMQVLFDQFQYSDLQKFCSEILKEKPIIDQEHPSVIEVLDFLWKKYNKGKFNFMELKEFAIKNNIVRENFFE